ncbi:MAG: DUF58 domain-containing protein [Planctomycetota bacterium]|nr:DUF58 domain-containing protein [Planctomycetota bacterium]MDA1138516.1 DUF58 domain-containing protein [Planctomycetota bacterium]
MNSTTAVTSLLTGDVVERVKQLELFSRRRVEGALAGDNKSPFKGVSTDFMQHREYFYGDNLKYLDWRVYGKTGRLYIKQYEDVTNTPVYLVVDISTSMDFQGYTFSKHEFTVRCAGLIAYLVHTQRDDFGLFLFNQKVAEYTRPASSKSHLARTFEKLVSIVPVGGTAFEDCFLSVQSQANRKGLVVVISDFMEDPHLLARSLGGLRSRGHDVIALHVYDELEKELDYIEFTRFRDLETNEITAIDPLLIQRDYREQFELHLHDMKTQCLKQGIDYVTTEVCDDFSAVIGAYLQKRMALML